MRARRGGVPLPDLPERRGPEAGRCVACGGIVTGALVPMWRQQFPGEVEYRCETCHVVETPEMRAQRRQTEMCVCAAPSCTVRFAPRRVGTPWEKRFCSETCSSRTRQAEAKAKQREVAA